MNAVAERRSTNGEGIVHASRTQRQHVRLRTPLAITLEGKTYETTDWSAAGFAITGAKGPFAVGAFHEVKLQFEFGVLELAVELNAEIRRHDPGSGKLAARFVNPDQRQLGLIHAIIDAVISGEIVRSGDILNALQRDSLLPARLDAAPPKPRLFAAARALVVLVGLWSVALGLIGFILVNGFSRAFIVAGSGVLSSPEASVVRPITESTILAYPNAVGTRVMPGAAVVSLEDASGKIQSLMSSCDCVIAETGAPVGAYVNRGAPLITLVPAQGRLWGTVMVPLETAQRLRRGDRATLSFFTTDGPVKARVEKIALPGLSADLVANSGVRASAGSSFAPNAVITLATDTRIPTRLAGQPILVRINTARIAGN